MLSSSTESRWDEFLCTQQQYTKDLWPVEEVIRRFSDSFQDFMSLFRSLERR